jgi:hypothetical protein
MKAEIGNGKSEVEKAEDLPMLLLHERAQALLRIALTAELLTRHGHSEYRAEVQRLAAEAEGAATRLRKLATAMNDAATALAAA